MNASIENEVIIKYYDQLQTMIQGEMQTLSAKALAKHLLTPGEHSKCVHPLNTAELQAMYFMQAVRNKVEVNPDCFYTLLGLLKAQPSYKFLVDKLEADVKDMKSKRASESKASPAVQPQTPPPESGDGGDGIDYDSIDGTTILDDSFDVTDEIQEMAVRFHQLGQSLRIRKAELDIIKMKYKDEPKDGLSAVIGAWVDQLYDVKRHGEPTWKLLAKAVAHPYGGSNCALARKIAKNHPVNTGQAT